MGHIIHHYKDYKYDQNKGLREKKSIKKLAWVENRKAKSLVVITSLKAEKNKGGTLIVEAHNI